MGGTTLHSSADIAVGSQAAINLTHTDIDLLFTRNQHLRWVIVHEGRMIPDEELKSGLARAQPYQQWVDQQRIDLEEIPKRNGVA